MQIDSIRIFQCVLLLVPVHVWFCGCHRKTGNVLHLFFIFSPVCFAFFSVNQSNLAAYSIFMILYCIGIYMYFVKLHDARLQDMGKAVRKALANESPYFMLRYIGECFFKRFVLGTDSQAMVGRAIMHDYYGSGTTPKDEDDVDIRKQFPLVVLRVTMSMESAEGPDDEKHALETICLHMIKHGIIFIQTCDIVYFNTLNRAAKHNLLVLTCAYNYFCFEKNKKTSGLPQYLFENLMQYPKILENI